MASAAESHGKAHEPPSPQSVTSARMEQEWPASPATVRLARHFVVRTLAAWDLDDLGEVASLLTSEIVANAVQHVGEVYRVALELDPDELRVEVFDRSPAMPVGLRPGPEAERGRGLFIVDRLASKWGASEDGTGKRVWFTLPRPRTAGATP